MKTKKIVTVLGARPQFIKASVVSRSLRAVNLNEVVVHTGQHFDSNMSGVFFEELSMAVPTYQLGIHGSTHGEMTGRMLAEVETILQREQPELVLVYGDTNSTLAGALAAAKLNIPIAHVEAGLRSFNRRMPEEVNRVLTDHMSHWLFAPTDAAVVHLRNEGIAGPQVSLVGDVMYDSVLHFAKQTLSRPQRPRVLSRIEGRPFVLATVHRAENTDDPGRLQAIVQALLRFADDIDVVLPLHPRTRSVLARMSLSPDDNPRLHCIEPIGYLDMIELEQTAQMVITDSGGVQKEAYFFGKPCVTLRDETEWVELVEAGWNRLAPPISLDNLLAAFRSALGTTGAPIQPYGAGDAADRIARILSEASESGFC